MQRTITIKQINRTYVDILFKPCITNQFYEVYS